NGNAYQGQIYRISTATLAVAQPTVTPVGPGRYAFDGAVTDLLDAAAIESIEIFVATVDFPNNTITGLAYEGAAQVTRNSDGTLSYTHTLPPDRALPPPPAG